jgi:hypothetical protein
MITLPAEISQGGQWADTSIDPATGQRNDNLDSKMDFAEHQRIVCSARELFAGAPAFAGSAAAISLQHLNDAYTTAAAGYVLLVSKGIHQPTTNPHIQLTLKHTVSPIQVDEYVFHLNVSASQGKLDVEVSDEFFHWRGVQFSAKRAGVSATWPVAVAVTPKDHLRRRMSLSPDGLQKMLEAIETEKARVAKEIADRQANVEKQRQAAAMQATIKALLGKHKYDLKNPRHWEKLASGGSAVITTQTKKTMTVKLHAGGNALVPVVLP